MIVEPFQIKTAIQIQIPIVCYRISKADMVLGFRSSHPSIVCIILRIGIYPIKNRD